MTTRTFLISSLLALCACLPDAIQDEPNSENLDRSSASWEEPGATPNLPLDAGSGFVVMDSGVDAGALDSGSAEPTDSGSDSDAPSSDAGADASSSDAGADASSSDAGADAS